MWRTGAVLLCAGLLGPGAASAGDGVIEINQAKALAGGVNACDAAGFPVTICDSGRYRLTSDLTHGGAAILIQVQDVDLDLNGMTVRGDNSCTTGPGGWVVSCAFLTVDRAIRAGARVTISNGRVIGSRGFGIQLADASEIRDVQVSANGRDGVLLGGRSSASNVSAIGNGGAGFSCGSECSLSDIEATNNGDIAIAVGLDSRVADAVVSKNFEGLRADPFSRVTDVVASENGGVGVFVGSYSSASGIVARANGGSGVVLGDSSSATGVSSSQNSPHGIELGTGCALSNFAAGSNSQSGVRALDGSFVSDGALRDNGASSAAAFALQVQGGAGYRALVITRVGGGNGATVSPGGVNLGNNSCQGLPCP